MAHDVVTFGEGMVRLAPPHFKRIEQSDSFDIEIGGTELNTAVGLARLGRSVTWVSRLGNNPLGQLIVHRTRATGVNVDHVLFSDTDRVGLYFLEFGAAPRASSILYDRTDSAMALIQPGMIDWKPIFHGAKWFHVTGITPAISPSSALATRQALQAARNANLMVSIDLNYRSRLWSLEQAGKWLTENISYANVLITTPDDVERFFGIPATDLPQMAATMVERYSLRAIAMTLRETDSVWRNRFTAVAFGAGQFFQTRTYDVEIVDRLGAGDAFTSGLIHGLLDEDLQKGLDYATALGAMKHTIPGDLPWITAQEVEALLQGGSMRIRR